MTLFENWGDYWWPGQYEECLRNILHLTVTDGREIHDPDELARLERQLSTIRAAELIHHPGHVARTFTPDHYHALHRWIFQDVFEWAGSPRVVTTLKGDSQFADPEDIDRLLGVVLDNFGDPARFRATSRDEFLGTLAPTFTGLLMIHPHLEGNGRTSRLFVQQIAEHAGYRIDWTHVPATQLIDATIAAFRLEPEPLQRILHEVTHPLHDDEPVHRDDLATRFRQRMRIIPQPGTPRPQPGSTQPPSGVTEPHRTTTRRPTDPDNAAGYGPVL